MMAASDFRQVILTSHRNKRLRRSLPKRSDHFLDAQFIPKTPKSPPRPSEHKSCYAYLLCLFWSMAQITPLDTQIAPRTLKAFPRHSDYKSCYACLFISMVQITPQTLKSAQITSKLHSTPSDYKFCLLILIAQITVQTLKATLSHTPNPHFTLKYAYPTIFYQLYVIKLN